MNENMAVANDDDEVGRAATVTPPGMTASNTDVLGVQL